MVFEIVGEDNMREEGKKCDAMVATSIAASLERERERERGEDSDEKENGGLVYCLQDPAHKLVPNLYGSICIT